MQKFMVYGLWYIVLFVLSIYYIPYTIYPTHAADSTPSADIKLKLEQLKADIASKAAKLKGEVKRKLQNKAYVGTVKTSSPTSLTLASQIGPKLVSINQDTIFESQIKKKKKFSQNTISEEDYLAALGDVDEIGVLTAKKVILLKPKPQTLYPKTYIWGQVVSVSEELVTLKERNLKNLALSPPSNTTVKLNDFIIATGSYNKNDIFEAEFVHIIQQGGILKPKKIVYPAPNGTGATPSAAVKPR